MALRVRAFGVRPLLPAIVPLMFGKTTLETKPDLCSPSGGQRFAALDVPSILSVLAALIARDSVVDRLGDPEAPALVIVGSEDRSLPPPCARQIAAGLRDATLLEVPGAGHLSTLKQPESVTGLL